MSLSKQQLSALRRYYRKHRERLLEYKRKLYIKNRDEVLRRMRKFKLDNPEKVRERNRRYNHSHRGQRNAAQRKWRLKNPEKVKKMRRKAELVYRKKHYKEIVARKRRWMDNNRAKEAERARANYWADPEKSRETGRRLHQARKAKLRSFDSAQHFVSVINNLNQLANIKPNDKTEK